MGARFKRGAQSHLQSHVWDPGKIALPVVGEPAQFQMMEQTEDSTMDMCLLQ